jgi:hypothetical protein
VKKVSFRCILGSGTREFKGVAIGSSMHVPSPSNLQASNPRHLNLAIKDISYIMIPIFAI